MISCVQVKSLAHSLQLRHCGWVLLLLLCVVCGTSMCAHGNEGLVLGMDLFNCRMSTLDDRRAADESGWGAEGGGQGFGAALE